MRLSFLLIWLCFSVVTSAQITYFTVHKMENDQQAFNAGARIIAHNIEHAIIGNPATEVVDRETFSDIEAERNRQKSESFIDGTYVEQGKSRGAHQIIFPKYISKDRKLEIKIVDVATSTTSFLKEYKLSHFVKKTGKVERPKYFARYIIEMTEDILKEFTTEALTIRIVNLEKIDKDKAKEALIYCPNNCKLKSKVSVDLLSKRTIPGTDLFKYDKIGEAKVKSDESNGLYLVSIKKGGEAVLQLNKEKIEIYAKLKT